MFFVSLFAYVYFSQTTANDDCDAAVSALCNLAVATHHRLSGPELLKEVTKTRGRMRQLKLEDAALSCGAEGDYSVPYILIHVMG